MRKFVDVQFFDGGEELGKKMGFWRVYGKKDVEFLEGKLRTLRKRTGRAWRSGKIPLHISRTLKDAKRALMVRGLVVVCRCGLDAAALNIAENHGSRIAQDLSWGRAHLKTLARNVWLLHRGHAKYLFFSGARSVEEVRAPRDMAALLFALGEEEPRALSALSTWWEDVHP